MFAYCVCVLNTDIVIKGFNSINSQLQSVLGNNKLQAGALHAMCEYGEFNYHTSGDEIWQLVISLGHSRAISY